MDSQSGKRRRGLLVLVGALICMLAFAASAHATITYNVTPNDGNEFDSGSPGDPGPDGQLSLREAVESAGVDGDNSVINLPAGTYALDPSQVGLFVDGDGTFTLTGAGARSTIIDGGGTAEAGTSSTTLTPVFLIAGLCKCPGGPADATISGVTVKGGDPDGNGGAFFVGNAGPTSLATLHLFDSTVSGNQSELDGAGIYNLGKIDVQRVTFSGNFAEADGSAIATKSLDQTDAPTRGFTNVKDNFATATIVNSTITNNTSDSDTGCEGGGAVEQQGGNTAIVNSTIVGNTSFDGTCEPVQPTGGGIDIENGPATVVNTIVSGNTASPGSGPGAAQRSNSPRVGPAGPTIPSNCSVYTAAAANPASLTSLGNNIESATDCGFTAANDQQNTDPKLGTLGNNGGQMDTMAPLAGSPAIDRANAANCPATDEIGTTRPQGPACDVGAFEIPVVPPVPAPAPPPAKPAAPKVGVAGVRRACVSKSFHVRFNIATSASVKSVIVKLDGKRIQSTTKGRFTLTINSRKLRSGRHRLTIVATDSAGQTTTTHKSFSVCSAAKPRRKAAPRFTG